MESLETRSLPSRIAAARAHLRSICVTGTNGKTTTTSMVEAIVAAAGEPSARITTLGQWVRGARLSEDATPEAFAHAVEAAAGAGVRTLALETTSRALAEGFANTWPAHVAVFTNLTRDHLDYHGTPERYLAAKAQLFLRLPADGTAVLNAADPASALLDEVTPAAVRRAAYAGRAVDPACAGLPLALAVERVTVGSEGTAVTLAPSDLARRLGGSLALAVVGAVHAENALAAAVAADAAGYPAEAIRAGLAGFAGVPGRFQVVGRGPLVVVDYAHTPDALARTLDLARGLVAREGGRVVCVFGCGGDRDAGKRGMMGRVAGERADRVVLTTDNPRGEAPDAIADAVAAGARGTRAELVREPDRAAAIAQAIGSAAARDVVVIAGKGHERTQDLGDRVLPFDDAEVAASVCARRHAPARS